MMISRLPLHHLAAIVCLLILPGLLVAAERKSSRIKAGDFNPQHETVELFQAMKDGTIKVQYIPHDALKANVLIENKTKKPLNVKLPAAFAGVPVLAQFGGGGGGMGGGGGGGGQAGGGGMGGMGGGGMGGGGGGGGGFFNVAPEKIGKFKIATVCLEHGKPDPNPRMKYTIIPIESYIERPAVIELMKMFGRGGMNQAAVQAAAWHLNNDLSWQELATKIKSRKRFSRYAEPYFTRNELQAAVAFSSGAISRAKSDSPGKSGSLSQSTSLAK